MTRRNAAYDYIRCIAMLAIILCHFFQIRDRYTLFSWFNLGVQVFFALSAKLMSQKDIMDREQIVAFYKKRLLRILLPAWIYLLCLVPLLFMVGRGPTLSAIFLYTAGMAGFAPSGVLGLGHFWFITVLLLCYLSVPVLNYIDRVARGMGPVKGFLLKATPVVGVVLIFTLTPWIYFGVNWALFITAYFYFRTRGNSPQWSQTLTLRLLPAAVAAIAARLYLDHMTDPNVLLYEFGSTTAKAVLGMFLFAMFDLMFSRTGKTHIPRMLTLLSDCSYEVYIVHQFIMLALYEYVPFFREENLGGGLALLGTSLLLISVNAAVLYIAKTKIAGIHKRHKV